MNQLEIHVCIFHLILLGILSSLVLSVKNRGVWEGGGGGGTKSAICYLLMIP